MAKTPSKPPSKPSAPGQFHKADDGRFASDKFAAKNPNKVEFVKEKK